MLLQYNEDRERFEAQQVAANTDLYEYQFHWDRTSKTYWTVDVQVAKQFMHCMDTPTLTEVYKREATERRNWLMSHKQDGPYTVPVPIGKKPKDFQRVGATQLINLKRGLLADDMGLGKTIQALIACNMVHKILGRPPRILIICPSSLRKNWMAEAGAWLIEEYGIDVATTTYWPMYAQVVITGYDALEMHYDMLRSMKWDVLIIDECQYIVNTRALRTLNVIGGNPDSGYEPINAEYVFPLSGTPYKNRPIELFPILHYLDPMRWPSRIAYGIRYCAGEKNAQGKWNFKGASNLEELNAKLCSTVMVRRLKDDVMKELPPKQRMIIEIPPAQEDIRAIKEELDAWRIYENKIADAKLKAEKAKAAGSKEEYELALASLVDLQRVAFKEMSAFRKKTGIAKIPYVLTRIDETLSSGVKKLVVFAHHHEVFEAIKKKYPNAAEVSGRAGTGDPHENVQRFQNDPDCELLLFSIVMAQGHTCTAAHNAIFAELAWVPSDIEQAEDRLHRIGQYNSVLYQFIVLENSLDANMAHKYVDKKFVQDRSLNSKSEMKDLPQATAVSAGPIDKKHDERSPERKKKALNPRNDDARAAIHEALKELSAMCDGARALDGMGFNANDTNYGKQLAALPALSEAQAWRGLRMIKRYRRQLPKELLERAKRFIPPE